MAAELYETWLRNHVLASRYDQATRQKVFTNALCNPAELRSWVAARDIPEVKKKPTGRVTKVADLDGRLRL